MHALPALTEAKENIKKVSFDWVADKNFASVPKWHPSVDKVITTDHRNWKKQFFSKDSRQSLSNAIKEIDANDYDLVVDMQNNLKSAFVSYLCKHEVVGMDAKSTREFPAHWAYSDQFSISKKMHAVDRQKLLLSKSLDYETNTKVNYGISKSSFKKPSINLPEDYMVIVQNASWKTKQWSIKNWKLLIKLLESKGKTVLIPSGDERELLRAREICSESTNSIALDIMSLNEVAYLIDQANFCICSDTGLAHLSAVVGTPSVTLYGPTKVNLIGTMGKDQAHITGHNNNINEISVSEVINEIPF